MIIGALGPCYPIRCLSCDGTFTSSDPFDFPMCPTCREGDEGRIRRSGDGEIVGPMEFDGVSVHQTWDDAVIALGDPVRKEPPPCLN